MNPVRIGVLSPSAIASLKTIPAITSSDLFYYAGVAVAGEAERSLAVKEEPSAGTGQRSAEKARALSREFGGRVFNSFEEMLVSDEIEAVYIPLPPALHYYWALRALQNGKHVLLEKPFTTSLGDTKVLLATAKEKQLAVHENYAFCYHTQMNQVMRMMNEGVIGEIRHVRSAFGFPYRGAGDFRYHKALGGGALFDCGGYPIKSASLILGNSAVVTAASLHLADNHDIDLFGSATLENDQQISAQVSFGMDNAYRCELELWGSKGCLLAPRIFTAPTDFSPEIIIQVEEKKTMKVPAEDQFLGSLQHFHRCMTDDQPRAAMYDEIARQSQLIDDVLRIAYKQKGVKTVEDDTDCKTLHAAL